MWNPKVECMPRKDVQALQLERLRHTVGRVYQNVPAYREKFDKAGVKPQDIKTLEDLQRLPFTAKDDLRQNYPFG
ncbi:MAG TPA: phenylacetate--CoA ligase, partial [bacterium]|nr:phenylacetate--CoA ligase [bacterium]